MEVSAPSQSLALAAYSAQQQNAVRPASPNERDNAAVDQTRQDANAPRRSGDVSFSPEALRLSAQSAQDFNRGTVNRSNESDTRNTQQQQQATSPGVTQAEAAKSVAQAINAYATTSVI